MVVSLCFSFIQFYRSSLNQYDYLTTLHLFMFLIHIFCLPLISYSEDYHYYNYVILLSCQHLLLGCLHFYFDLILMFIMILLHRSLLLNKNFSLIYQGYFLMLKFSFMKAVMKLLFYLFYKFFH